MPYSNFVPIIGTIMNISRGTDCCSQRMTLRAASGMVNFVISPETLVIDCQRLRPGMRAAAFFDSSMPVPLIYPPQYRAQIVTQVGKNELVTLKFFDNSLTASDGSLRLNMARSTVVETANGQTFSCSPRRQFLLVYYTAAARSIPPQTTPRKVVVFCT